MLSLLLSGLITMSALAQTPTLNSYSNAQATVFLDFDGHYVQGTAWNWSGPIQALPSGLSASAITEIFNRVAEDYRIFNLNITTDSTVYRATPTGKRIRMIITSTYEWYGKAGGAAYVGSFAWGDDTPAWVFSNLLNNNIKNVAEAISHETGHTLGLQHQSTYNADCIKTAEYAGGQGSGEIGWAPIMGVGYYKNLTTWHKGANTISCHELQNDVDIIAGTANKFGLRTDDHANTLDAATPVNISGFDFAATGLINSPGDRDIFKFSISNTVNFRINATPQNIGAGNAGANLDIQVLLVNQYADTIGRYNPAELLNAGLDSNLNSGTYYLVVDGVGNVNLAEDASLGFYAITGSIGQVLPVHRFTLSGKIQGDQHALNWFYEADEAIKRIEVEYSTDGVHFTALVPLTPENRSFTWKPTAGGTLYYRARALTVADERAYYSNIISLRKTNNGTYKLQSNLVGNSIQLNNGKEYAYQLLDETGRLLQRGILPAGANRIDLRTTQKGLLLLRLQAGQESHCEKLIKH